MNGPPRGGGRLGAWLQASRLPSQSYIALPLVLGQALAAAQGHPWRLSALVVAQAFGLFDQLYIVWANDYADRDTDRQNRTATLFSGGSRVLVEGRLEPAALLRAATSAASLAVAASLLLALAEGRWLLVPLALVALALLWAYSFPPLRLSYRGGGEVLQALGTAFVLPLYGYYAQVGSTGAFPWLAGAVLLPAQLACAISTTLPDEPSDRASDKRTAAVRLGPEAAAALVGALHVAAAAAYALAPWSPRGPAPFAFALPSLLAAALQFVWRGARPGTLAMTLRVGCAVTASIALAGAMLAALLAP